MDQPRPGKGARQGARIRRQPPRGRTVAPVVKAALDPIQLDHVQPHASHRIALDHRGIQTIRLRFGDKGIGNPVLSHPRRKADRRPTQ